MWTVLPLKALSPVKTRLASMLSPGTARGPDEGHGRRCADRAQGLPAGGRGVAGQPGPEIPALADAYGAKCWCSKQDKDLNSAVQAATDFLAGKGIDAPWFCTVTFRWPTPLTWRRLIDESEHCELHLLPCNRGRAPRRWSPRCPPVPISLWRRQLPAASRSRAAKPAALETQASIFRRWPWISTPSKICLTCAATTGKSE